MEAIFPASMKTFRHHVPAQHMVASLLGVNSLLYLLRKPNSRRARALEILLPTKERIHLRHRKEGPRGGRETIAGILNRQSAGFEGGEGPDGKEHASVYSSQGEHGDYTGFLRDWRKCGKRTGTLQRCWEHVERIRHRGRPDGGRKRRAGIAQLRDHRANVGRSHAD